MDHCDKEAVGVGVKRLQDIHCYGYGSARGLTLFKARDHPSRNREPGRGGRVPRFEAVLEGVSAPSGQERTGG